MGIPQSDLVKDILNYLEDEKKVRNTPQVKEILKVFPNAHICWYKRKE